MPSVSPASAKMPGARSSAMARPARNSALRPPLPLPRTVTVVSPPEMQNGRRLDRLAVAARRERDAGHDTAEFARLALQRVAEDERRHVRRTGDGGRRFEAGERRGDDDGAGMAQPFVAGLGGLVLRLGQPRGDRIGRRDGVAGEDGAGVGEGGRVGDGRAGGDDREVVAGHVGDGERHQRRRPGGGGQPPALDRREVLAHRVHRADVGAGGEQRAVHRLLVGERDAIGRQRQKGRAAARDQAEHQVVGAGGGGAVPGCAGRRPRRARSGTGWAASTISMRWQGTAWP